MPSSKEKQVSKTIIDAFKIAVAQNPDFKALPRSFKKHFVDSVLTHIDSNFGHDDKQARRFIHGTVKMASDDNALQNALNTAPDATPTKILFQNYGHFIEYIQRASQATEAAIIAKAPSVEPT